MEITLEKIELVKDRTGVSYKEAKDALEAADGSVVDAIINIEETIDSTERKSAKEQGSAVLDAVKELIKRGNVAKIVVKSKTGETLVNIPVNAGIVGTIIAPWGAVAGVVASIGFKCVVEIVKGDGTVIDVSDRASDFAGKAAEKGSEFAGAAKAKATEVHSRVRDRAGEKIDDAKEKAGEAFDSAKDKASDAIDNAADAIKNKMGKDSEGYSFE
ncbi:MAG: DUF4342 domain-containing protein [Eubacteriaceae bacterium]|nr:DUF4342 domain-containing protein [Eubacteriaceae bacterium]